jgi:hypothetical protein
MPDQPDFAADLGELTTSVKGDVSKILDAVKVAGQTATRAANESREIPAIPRPPVTPRVRKAGLTLRSAERAEEEPIKNSTTRLKKSTKELLADAVLHQRLKRVKPASQQGIIEEALWDWFKRNGYTKKNASEEAAGEATDEEGSATIPKIER